MREPCVFSHEPRACFDSGGFQILSECPLEKTFRALVRRRRNGTAPMSFPRCSWNRRTEVMAEMTSVFPSVRAVLEVLSGRGLSLGIVSTKFRYRIKGILQREGLERFFRVIVGGEDVSAHKPDPSGLLGAVRALGEFLFRQPVCGRQLDRRRDGESGVAFRSWPFCRERPRKRNSRIRGRWEFWMIWDNCREFWIESNLRLAKGRVPALPVSFGFAQSVQPGGVKDP